MHLCLFQSFSFFINQVHGQITVSYKMTDVSSQCSIGWIMHTFKRGYEILQLYLVKYSLLSYQSFDTNFSSLGILVAEI